jgi:hypothetical protein
MAPLSQAHSMSTRWLCFISLSLGIAFADPAPAVAPAPAAPPPTEITTTDGHKYTKVKILAVEDDGITIMCDSGVSLLPFSILPIALQKQFNYDPQKAAKAEADRVKKEQEEEADYQAAEQRILQARQDRAIDASGDKEVMARSNWRYLSGQVVGLQEDGFILDCSSANPASDKLDPTSSPDFVPCAYGTFFIRSLGAQSTKPVAMGDSIRLIGAPNGERNEMMGPLPVFEAVPTHLLTEPQLHSVAR